MICNDRIVLEAHVKASSKSARPFYWVIWDLKPFLELGFSRTWMRFHMISWLNMTIQTNALPHLQVPDTFIFRRIGNILTNMN